MNNYKKLDVWQKGVELVSVAYKLTEKLPRSESFNLISQIQRAAISIPSNIAEGSGRGSDKEFVKFLYIARGSLYELETLFELCKRLNFISDNDFKLVCSKILEQIMMVNGLIRSLKNNF